MKNILLLTAIGLLSGILTAVCMTTYEIFGILTFVSFGAFLAFFPGILFGLGLAMFLNIVKKEKEKHKFFAIIAFSALAYFAAYFATNNTPLYFRPFPFVKPVDSSIFISGGVVGALALALGIRAIIHKLKLYQIVLFTLLGGLLGFFGWTSGESLVNLHFYVPFLNFSEESPYFGLPGTNLFSLFVIWQTGMAFILGVCMKLNEVKIPTPEGG